MYNNKKLPMRILLSAAISAATLGMTAHADQYSDAADQWLTKEFGTSTLTKAQQEKEMAWFTETATRSGGGATCFCAL